MEFKLSPEDEEFRQDLRKFVQTESPSDWEGGGRWPEETDWDLTREMRKKLADKGWLTMHCPRNTVARTPPRFAPPFSTRKWPICVLREGTYLASECSGRL